MAAFNSCRHLFLLPVYRFLQTLFSTLLFFTLSLSSFAQQVINFETRRYDTRDSGWTGNLEFMFNLVQNVNQVLTMGNKLDLGYQKADNSYLFLNEFNFVRANNKNLERNSYQHLRYKKYLNPWLSGEAYMQTQTNQMIGLKFRGLLGAGPRFRVFDNDSMKIFMSIKWLYTYEETTDETLRNIRNRLSLYGSLLYFKEKNFNFDLVFYYQPDIIDFSDVLIQSEFKAEWMISRKLAFRFALSENYNSRPPAGYPAHALGVKNSLVYKLR